MKKVSVLFIAILLSTLTFGQNEEPKSNKTQLDIYYFHRTERCNTCLSIEENTKTVLEQYFEDESKNGTVSFKSINFEGETDKEIIDKYEADGPSLFLTKVKKEKEKIIDMTDFALENSLYNSDKFKNGLRDKINELLR